MTPTKACPVVLRGAGTGTEILVFGHPRAGVQLVKGTIEPGETAAQAALRELAEEAGLHGATVQRGLGAWRSGFQDQTWSFELVHCPTPLPDTWHHATRDDGGHVFRFFWHRLRADPGPAWHPVYGRALGFIRDALAGAEAGVAPQRAAR